MEFFGRLQTSPVAGVAIGETTRDGNRAGNPVVVKPIQPIGSVAVSSFSSSHGGRFGNGRIVDSNVRDRKEVTPGTVLHTIAGGVSDYYARGFLEEAAQLYDPSPHAGFIAFLDRTSGVKESRSDREYFVLVVSSALAAPITITDWKVFDRHKKTSHKLPKGVKVPGTEGTQRQIPVKIEAGDKIIVSSGRSPIGFSFHVNKCSGYRSQFKNFVPTVKTNCPDPLEEFIADGTVPYTDNECYKTVDRMRRCTVITHIPAIVTNECRDFLENVVTERGCVSLHRNDPDFFTREWRLFLESRKDLWKNENNILYLLDDENRMVATLVYR